GPTCASTRSRRTCRRSSSSCSGRPRRAARWTRTRTAEVRRGSECGVTTFLDPARRLGPELVALRRRLHRVPELDRDLPKTQALVLEALAGLDLEVTVGERLSSVTAVLRGGGHDGSGPVVLLRGDMDALPVREDTGADFASEHEGRMHACGHDLHVA